LFWTRLAQKQQRNYYILETRFPLKAELSQAKVDKIKFFHN